MPRRARVLSPGVALHLLQRGHIRFACLYADEDYQLYLALLAELAPRMIVPFIRGAPWSTIGNYALGRQ